MTPNLTPFEHHTCLNRGIFRSNGGPKSVDLGVKYPKSSGLESLSVVGESLSVVQRGRIPYESPSNGSFGTPIPYESPSNGSFGTPIPYESPSNQSFRGPGVQIRSQFGHIWGI